MALTKMTKVQVPIERDLLDKAKKLAEEYGFDSIQNLIRVLLTQFVNGNLHIGFVMVDTPSEKRRKHKPIR